MALAFRSPRPRRSMALALLATTAVAALLGVHDAEFEGTAIGALTAQTSLAL